ncbi:hypothetical protein PF006_g31909, partial [Phytophthora fragariae]
YSALDWVQDTWRAIKTGRPQDNSHELPSDTNQSSALSLNCAGASDESVAEVSGTSGASVSHTLRLSVKARCPGRKKKNVKQATVDERASRRWYEASEEAKDKAGYRSLRDLIDALDQHKPSLTETTERLSGVIVKGGAYDHKKVSYKKLRNPVLIRDSFYLLPPILLKACMEAFPVSNSECDAIAVYDEADSSSSRSINAADNDLVEVVYIKDFGYFSRAQIELFKRVENLKNACVLGGKLKVWLLQEVIGSVDAHIHGEVRAFADQVLTTYPYAQINGLEAIPDHDFSMLYRAAPPVWLSDACIRALCERLVHDFASARFAGVQNAKQQPKCTRNRQSQEVDPCVLDKVREAAAISNMETVMIPVNFENSHWVHSRGL